MVKNDRISRYISIISNKLRREIDALSFRGEYSGTEGKALHFILVHADSDLFQKDIEQEFGLRPPSASILMRKMEDDGLITREPVSFDGRYKRIVPTEKAMRNKANVMEDVENLEARLLKGIPNRELDAWLKTTKKMIDNL